MFLYRNDTGKSKGGNGYEKKEEEVEKPQGWRRQSYFHGDFYDGSEFGSQNGGSKDRHHPSDFSFWHVAAIRTVS